MTSWQLVSHSVKGAQRLVKATPCTVFKERTVGKRTLCIAAMLNRSVGVYAAAHRSYLPEWCVMKARSCACMLSVASLTLDATPRSGGGEYGIAWREAGSCANKQNVFDDFIACAEYLQAEGYTCPGKLVIQACFLPSSQLTCSAQSFDSASSDGHTHLKGWSCCRVAQMVACWSLPAQIRCHAPDHCITHRSAPLTAR